ncbi:prepilin-type N-terminal cleavage/methylation domain-containing protein, partial [bacterium]|nr:prepilin-type N-terminal cleavage/methylation domain-containing protein [bacterium]
MSIALRRYRFSPNRRRGREGFTLVEVVVSIGLLTV